MAKSRMRRAICFDTAPMIWGVREDSDGHDFHMIERTKKYIKNISDAGYAIMVPSPVVAEYLVGATQTQFHEKAIICQGFEHPDLDIRCAELAAKLQRGGMVDEIHKETGIPKPSIRIDSFIIAIAIINEADKIVTHNLNEFKRLARGQIEIIDVPVVAEQQTMRFGESKEDDRAN